MPFVNTGPPQGGVSLGFVIALVMVVMGFLMVIGIVPVTAITVGGAVMALGVARVT